ncbi:hypothetical protein FHN55_20685 [Streptomyces sp. NP160]|uniref:lipopolysaccharide biosynthesis protein n=1 Tax=Streptomyces sp. NP160 TaxID=2586637 RepID=UPI00111B960C|nr:hypothetical protein [Streptomyces sp. NP160]TNM59452.1 hypothetical protein FHN55_20685 [Streptomyces sp. NP160]
MAGFAGLPLLSLLAPFLLLPLLARVGGQEGWAAVLLGQSAGGLGAVVAGLGWGLVGPVAVARADAAQRREVYARSLASRGVVVAVAMPVCALVAAALSEEGHRWTAAAMSTAMVVGALSPSWFSIGIGRPSAIAVFEILPRLVAIGLSAVLVLTTQQLWTYPALLALATAAGTWAYGRRVVGVRARQVLAVRAWAEVWRTRAASGTVAVGGSYSQTPLLVAGVVVSDVGLLASFGSADRLYRLSLTAVQALTSALQGWVAERPVLPGERTTRRMRAGLALHAALGAAGLVGFSLLGPWLSGLLFTEELAADRAVSVLVGVAFLAVSLNTALGRLVLVPLGATGTVFTSTLVGAVVGLVGMVGAGAVWGTTGVAAGFALSEVAVTGYQAWAVLRRTALEGPARHGPTAESPGSEA